MDDEEARRTAVAEFARRMGPRWIPEDWSVSGPSTETLWTLTGNRPHLVFRFTPLEESLRESAKIPRLSVAVDPETGDADMLR